MNNIRQEILEYIEANILPQYAHFDKAHGVGHARKVIVGSLALVQELMAGGASFAMTDVIDMEMVYVIAAYHDIGLSQGRKNHEKTSAERLLADDRLRKWFSGEALAVMAEAVTDHRASNAHAPRSIYGCIVAEADRDIDYMTILTRTLQYSLANFPAYSYEEHFERTYAHLHEKYGEGGYMRLCLDAGENKRKLDEMRQNMKSREGVREDFDALYAAQTLSE